MTSTGSYSYDTGSFQKIDVLRALESVMDHSRGFSDVRDVATIRRLEMSLAKQVEHLGHILRAVLEQKVCSS